MKFINQFREFLEGSGSSVSTSKNYLSDIKFFSNWYLSFYREQLSVDNLNQTILDAYVFQNSQKLARSTLKRHLSSLSKFAVFLKAHGHITENPLIRLATQKPDRWELRKIKDYLYTLGASPVSIKNYMSDITQFLSWLEKVTPPKAKWIVEENTYDKLSQDHINEYKVRLTSLNFSPLSINRKLSSLRKLVSWAHDEGKIPSNFLNQKPGFPFNARGSSINLKAEVSVNEANLEESLGYSRFAPLRLTQRSFSGVNKLFDYLVVETISDALRFAGSIVSKTPADVTFASNIEKVPRIQPPLRISNIGKSFYDPLNVSTKHLSVLQKITHIIRFNRPKWYLKYHTYPVVHYLHFAVLIVFMSMLGVGAYQRLIAPKTSVLGASDSSPSRVITVKQKLLDHLGNPITSPSSVRFAIYDDPKASGSALLWEETDSVNPDSSGVFNTTIGQNEKIPSEIFRSYASLWLGLSVEASSELKPRSQLSQVSYAANAQMLQNMGIANLQNYTNSILALDSSGNLSLGGEISHTIESVYGELILSGNKLTLSTILGTNSNIEIAPDGYGTIDAQKPIQNTSNNNNVLSAIGSVEFDDNVSILATTSSQAAFTISQNDIGGLISAYTGGIAKFTVDNLGNTTLAGDISLSGNNPNIFASANSAFSIGSRGKGVLSLQPISSGNIEFFSPFNTLSASGTLRLSGNLVLASQSATTTFGGVTYSWPTSTPSAGTFLKATGNGALSWSPIPDLTTIWNQTGGNVGIGTTAPGFRLDISDSQSATSAAAISNTSTSNSASGLIVKLGNTSGMTDSSNKWLTFEQAGIGIVGLIRGNSGTTGVTYQTNGIADFAEYLRKDETDNIPFGSILCLGSRGLMFACNQEEQDISGIASERPAFVGGENLGNKSIAVGLSGQVLARVSNLEGEIKPGDSLTSSRIPGVAVRANNSGKIVGKALSGFGASDCSFDPSNNFGLLEIKKDKVCEGKIYVLLNITYFEPSLAEKTNQIKNTTLKQTAEGFYETRDLLGRAISKTEVFGNILVGNLTAGLINVRRIAVDNIDITGRITIGGQDIKDYIAEVLGNAPEIKSPIASLDVIRTNVISPLSEDEDIKVKLTEKSSLTIENSSGSAVASINSHGDASFSGSLASREVKTQNLVSDQATIAGTLRAGKIIADSIEGLINTKPENNFADISSFSGSLVYVNNLRALTGNFEEGLIAQRPSTFADISVFGQLKVDNSLILASNSINVLGADLEIQSLRQGGLSLMAGLIYIDTEGNVKFGGNALFEKNVTVRGTLSANVISPLPDQDLDIKDSTGSSLLSLSRQGNLVSSGSATFNKLNFSLVQPAFALSPTEAIATGSAGTATISVQQKEITIRNNLVTDKSLIYVTPKIDTGNTVLYLIRQVPGISFTVGINTRLTKEVPFNWIIIN